MESQLPESSNISTTTQTKNIVLLIAIFVFILTIYKMYQTALTPKSFLVMVYLYMIFSLIFITFVGINAKNSQISDKENGWKLIMIYFVLACGGISLMMTNSMIPDHIGYIFLLTAIGLVIGFSIRYSTNVTNALIITAFIVLALTLIVSMSSQESLINMSNWLPTLLVALFVIIIIELIIIVFTGGLGQDSTMNKVLGLTVILLFCLFILSDSSRLLVKAGNLTCDTHKCINYPLETSNLTLDYVNIFARLLNH